MLRTFKTLLAFAFALGGVISVYYLVIMNLYGYEAGLAAVLPWVLCLASLACFAWARRWLMPVVAYGLCSLWFVVVGGLAYVWPFVLMLVLSIALMLFMRRKRKVALVREDTKGKTEAGEKEAVEAKAVSKAETRKVKAKAADADNPQVEQLACPNPRCKSTNIRVVGMGAMAEFLCLGCGKLFDKEECDVSND